MATIEHSALSAAELHEPKGASSATEGRVYVADGLGSGFWHYLPTGWGYYADAGAGQVVGTTDVKLQNDGAGASTNEAYLPFQIRGTGSLWDVINDKITPINIGDSYDLRIDLPITAETGAPTELTMTLDIGGAGTVTNAVAIVSVPLNKTPPYEISIPLPIFCLTTFNTNGGQIFLHVDSGDITVTNPTLYIGMNTSGAI